MSSTPSLRRGFALIGGPVLAVLFATAVTAGPQGPRHAHGTFVDASGSAIGSLHLTQDARGVVHVNVQVQGLSTGLHGIHIHAVGSCVAPTFASAGGHYNPFAHQHGLENPNGPHAGDMPNVEVAANGVLDQTVVLPNATMAQLLDADGSSIMIHANADDYVSQPSGNSGPKIACAVIQPQAELR